MRINSRRLFDFVTESTFGHCCKLRSTLTALLQAVYKNVLLCGW